MRIFNSLFLLVYFVLVSIQNNVTILQKTPTVFNQNGDYVFIYSENNCSGKYQSLKEGTHNLSQFGNDWNNTISSIKIPNNFMIEIYIDENLKGNSIAFYGTKTINKEANKSIIWVGEINKLNPYWNNKISSIKITKNQTK